MGGCIAKSSFRVSKHHDIKYSNIQPFLFSIADAEQVLMEAEAGDYLLYKDHDTDRIVLSVRRPSYIRHYRITELNSLYYLEGQPYAYLDSIVLYHRKHKLNGAKLNKQAYLSARTVKTFAHRVARSNGNFHLYANKNTMHPEHLPDENRLTVSSTGHSRTSSYASLLTSSSDSASRRQRL